MKFAAVFALVFSFALDSVVASAAEAPKFVKEMKLQNTDARLMFSSMTVNPVVGTDGLGPFMTKTDQIGSLEQGNLLSITCSLIAGGEAAVCDLKWTTSVKLEAGATVTLPETFSQWIVSRISLLPRQHGWSSLNFSEFSLACMQTYTPTDLPIYTTCTISLAAN